MIQGYKLTVLKTRDETRASGPMTLNIAFSLMNIQHERSNGTLKRNDTGLQANGVKDTRRNSGKWSDDA